MSQFSTNETVSLDKIIDNIENITKTNYDEIVEKYKISNCVQWIKENNFERVCLQFPNRYLPDAVNVVLKIEQQINNKVYLLADTAYESCCIDYVAAKHINADAIIHFGESCYSELLENDIPVLRINYQYSIDRQKFIDNLITFLSGDNSNVIYLVANEQYIFLIDEIKSYLNDNLINRIKCINIKDFRRENDSDFSIIFVGKENREIANFQHFFQVEKLYFCNVNDKNLEIRQFTSNNRAVKRRNYLIEIIKDAQTIGIIVGTLAVKNYLKIVARLQKLCKIHRKKCYVLSVGKPNVAKLANFPEMDVFVVIACPFNEIYDSREFYKPIVMPYDVEVALNLNINLNIYNPYDYNEIDLDQQLDNNIIDRSENGDVSLISGKLRGNCNVNDDILQSNSAEITVRNDMKIVENYSHGAVYLANRSWQGLEPKLGETEPKLATTGRAGLAKGYQNENH